MAPLSGAVVGTLTPAHGRAARMQMSFRITAVAATAPSAPAGVDQAGCPRCACRAGVAAGAAD